MNGADDTGTLVAPEVSRVCVRWGGQEDGMSSDHSDLQLHSPRTGGGGGGACCSLLLVCTTEGCGWCVKGVLSVL